MKPKGVIFDFNGTLLWDTHLHNRAWDRFLENHKINMTDSEKDKKIHGKNNRDILRTIIHKNLTDREIFSLAMEKEQIYQDCCIEENIQLAEGVTDYFAYLAGNSIPFTIATASGIENIDF